uniref:Uncharacterized protein n=1 Tax=Arundo donax TaxID=35708 RepID=A0A0A9G0M0_ARUDO
MQRFLCSEKALAQLIKLGDYGHEQQSTVVQKKSVGKSRVSDRDRLKRTGSAGYVRINKTNRSELALIILLDTKLGERNTQMEQERHIRISEMKCQSLCNQC